LRGGQLILSTIATVLPLSPPETQKLFARIGETFRISAYGKLLLVSIQDSFARLMFWWIGLPTPLP